MFNSMNQLRAKFILSISAFPLYTFFDKWVYFRQRQCIYSLKAETCIIFKAIEMDVADKRFFPVSCWSSLAL